MNDCDLGLENKCSDFLCSNCEIKLKIALIELCKLKANLLDDRKDMGGEHSVADYIVSVDRASSSRQALMCVNRKPL